MRKFFEFLKSPPAWFIVLWIFLTLVATTGAILCVAIGESEFPYDVISYALYAVAAVTVGYSVYMVVIFVPKAKQAIVGLLQKYQFTNRMMEQYGFRTVMFAVVAFVISLGNALINGTTGIMYLSLWYGALGAYYLLLSVMRGSVLLYHKNRKKTSVRDARKRELNTYRICGALLVLLPLALSFAILEIVKSDRAFVHAGLMIYVSATYTCYKVVTSFINFFKARRGDEMTVRAIRNINLADALVSVLALQTAMFHEFSPGESFGFANALTGACVCALTAVIGVFMLGNGTLKMKKIQQEEMKNER